MTDQAGQPATQSEITDALRLVLMFYEAPRWDDVQRDEWLRITGTREATTKTMCDHVRSVLSAFAMRE